MAADLQAAKPLTGVGVLVTRPAHQAQALCQAIAEKGGQAICFPVLEIVDPENSASLSGVIDRLDSYDIAVFISPNAVNRALNIIFSQRRLPESLKIAAVGKGSAKALQALGVTADIFPASRFNSESLLALDDLQQVSTKRIIVFRGEGGRELLAETLRARGAIVEYAECYRRVKPKADIAALMRHWARGEIDIIPVTSNEGLRNLFDMVGQLGRKWLQKTPLVVVSQRAVDLAQELGFVKDPIVCEANDNAIVKAIIGWRVAQVA